MSLPVSSGHDDPRLRLCVVTDDLRDGTAGLVQRAQAAERGGASMMVVRLKHADARTLEEAARALVTALGIPVIVSERLDVALAAGAAGVLIAPGSMPAVAIRTRAEAGMLIGVSASSESELLAAAGSDFVALGPVFVGNDEPLGLEAFGRLVAGSTCPVVAIGVHAAEQVALVRSAGAVGVMMMGEVMASDDPEGSAAVLSRAL